MSKNNMQIGCNLEQRVWRGALRRLQGQWMWEPLPSPGSDGYSDRIKECSWVTRPVRSHLFITAGGRVSHIQQVCNGGDSNDAWCMSSADVNDLSTWTLLSKWLQLTQPTSTCVYWFWCTLTSLCVCVCVCVWTIQSVFFYFGISKIGQRKTMLFTNF